MNLKRLVAQRPLCLLTSGVIALTISCWSGGNELVGSTTPLASATAPDQSPFRDVMEISNASMLTGSIPKGWKTYTYRSAVISVPRSWVVRHANYSCGDTTLPGSGTLFLLPPATSDVCVRSAFNTDSVSLSRLPTGDTYIQPSCPPVTVNRLTTYIGPCTSSNAAGITVWSVPALGIEAIGTGTASENVTGGGKGTIVGRVLHTLRRRR
jgi:hypothetical protein